MDELSPHEAFPIPWLGLKFHVSRDLVFPDDPFSSVSDWSYREDCSPSGHSSSSAAGTMYSAAAGAFSR
jgi:hypothetical protein